MVKKTRIADISIAQRSHGIVAVVTTSYANEDMTAHELEQLAAEFSDVARQIRNQQRIAKGRSWT